MIGQRGEITMDLPFCGYQGQCRHGCYTVALFDVYGTSRNFCKEDLLCGEVNPSAATWAEQRRIRLRQRGQDRQHGERQIHQLDWPQGHSGVEPRELPRVHLLLSSALGPCQ